MTVGERIRQKRIELELSQDELAKRVNYKSRSSIQKIECARDLPLNKVELMAKALGCTPSYLMGWEDEDGEPTLLAEVGNAYQKREAVEKLSKYGANDIDLATHLYDLYLQAPPEIQAAVETLLKSQLCDS